MPKVAKRPRVVSKLPNAPLAEVVFEIRWRLVGADPLPAPFNVDPGYYVCSDNLSIAAEKLGFGHVKRIAPLGTAPAHSIDLRFYRSEAESFPLLQLGPGIFAVNESTSYTWSEYKELCINGLRAFLASYPNLKSFPLVPIQVELKYVDAFKGHGGKESSFLSFLNSSTNINLSLPEFLTKSDVLGQIDAGRLNLAFPINGLKRTRFSVVVANGKVADIQSMIMESRFVTTFDRSATTRDELNLKKMSGWLEKAHSITSPFFTSVTTPSLMSEFLKDSHA